jgi:steroid delta-isomerase-like uncharacterized protein
MGDWRNRVELTLEALSRGEIDLEVFDENVEFVDPMLAEPAHSRTEVRAYVERFLTAFPDAKFTLRDCVETDDAVVLEVTFTGTHLGPAQVPAGVIPPTGQGVSIESCQIARILRGKIVHYRTYVDTMQLLAQLGLLPDPAPA